MPDDEQSRIADDDSEQWIEEFARLSGIGDSKGQRFDRDEIHERPLPFQSPRRDRES